MITRSRIGKRWATVIVTLVVVASVIALYVVPVMITGRASVSTPELLVPSAGDGGHASVWEVVRDNEEPKLGHFHANSGFERVWDRDGSRDTGRLIQAAHVYDGPLRADLQYALSNPRLHGYPTYNTIDAGDGLGADRSVVACVGGGDSSGCGSWLYWARYGQYIVLLRLIEVGITGDEFLSLVDVVDEHIAGVLS